MTSVSQCWRCTFRGQFECSIEKLCPACIDAFHPKDGVLRALRCEQQERGGRIVYFRVDGIAWGARYGCYVYEGLGLSALPGPWPDTNQGRWLVYEGQWPIERWENRIRWDDSGLYVVLGPGDTYGIMGLSGTVRVPHGKVRQALQLFGLIVRNLGGRPRGSKVAKGAAEIVVSVNRVKAKAQDVTIAELARTKYGLTLGQYNYRRKMADLSDKPE